MKIIRLEAEHVKRLTAIDITPNDGMTIIGGRNGQGKSSALDCVELALGGKSACPQPLRRGEDSGFTRVTMDTGLVVQRSFTEKGERLTVTSGEGFRAQKPQGMLDKLVGPLSFDPLAFQRLKPKEQLAELQALVGLDCADIDGKRKQAYADRTTWNAEVKRLKGYSESLADVPPGTPAEPVNVSAILAELDAAQETNRLNDVKRMDLEDAKSDLGRRVAETVRARQWFAEAQDVAIDAHARISTVEDESEAARLAACEVALEIAEADREAAQSRLDDARTAARIRADVSVSSATVVADSASDAREDAAREVSVALLAADACDADRIALELECAELEDVDTDPIRARINGAEDVNAAVRLRVQHKAASEDVVVAQSRADALTAKIAGCDTERRARVAAVELPVESLSLSEDGITFHGVPLEQASAAEKLRVSMAIGLASNPTLPIVLIREGAFLDSDSLRMVGEMADAAGAQVFVERVGVDAGAIVIENGTVAEVAK